MSDPAYYKVWVHIEPLDEEGEPAGEDIDFNRGGVGVFTDEEAAVAFAQLLHDVGDRMIDTLMEKRQEVRDE